MPQAKGLIAPCGLDCFNCKLYEKNLNEKLKQVFMESMRIPAQKLPCRDCRGEKGQPLVFPLCATYVCAEKKRVDFCFECDEFPCSRLLPVADGADRYPHNYNHCITSAG